MSPKLLTLSFLLEYFKYLNTWNTSASLVSMIVSISDDIKKEEEPTTKYLEELEKIAEFEWLDTGGNFNHNNEKIMSLHDFYYTVMREVRDKKIDSLLNLK